MNISLKALSRARVPIVALSLAMTVGLGCQAEHDSRFGNKQATIAPAKKGLTVNPQIDLKVDTSNSHVVVYATWKNTSDTDTFFFDPWQVFRDSMMEGSVLQIEENGRKIAFLGPMVKRRASLEKDRVRLEPGQTLNGQQDITGKYEFAAGTHAYTLQYAAFLKVSTPEQYTEVRSQPVTFTLVH